MSESLFDVVREALRIVTPQPDLDRALTALDKIEGVLMNVPDYPATDREYAEWLSRRWAVVSG